MSAFVNFAEVLAERAAEHPEQISFRFLGDTPAGDAQLTSAELDRRARSLAALLQAQGGTGARALLLCPPGLDYIVAFYACLYAGTIAVPAYPPSPIQFAAALRQLETTARDAGTRFVVSSTALAAGRDSMQRFAPELCALPWIAVDARVPDAADSWRPPPCAADALAFLQYTSGSTGAPKGVMVTHANLLHNTLQMQRVLRGGPDDRHVCWLPPYHDMGLIAGILMVSRFGMRVTLLAPNTFVREPLRWLRAISDTQATITGAPTFGFDLAARRIEDAQLEGLDLSSLRVACIAAERVRSSVIERFAKRFAACGFRRDAFLPCYGLAESTLMSTGGFAEKPVVEAKFDAEALDFGRVQPLAASAPGRTLIGCGSPIDGVALRIVNPETTEPCASHEIGEIWLAGASIARGYWNNPSQSAQTFGARLAQGDGPYLRTGDLGFMHEDELFVVGRIKDTLLVRGRNHYAEDLEATATAAHPLLRPDGAAVFAVELGQREAVVLVHEVDTRELDALAVVHAVRGAIAEQHGVRLHAVVLIRARTLAKTTSGKIRRAAIKRAYLANELQSAVHRWVDPRDATAQQDTTTLTMDNRHAE